MGLENSKFTTYDDYQIRKEIREEQNRRKDEEFWENIMGLGQLVMETFLTSKFKTKV